MYKITLVAFFILLLSSCNQRATNKVDCKPTGPAVCAQPPMKPCPEGMMCTQVMPSPKLYTNECEASKEKAETLDLKFCN